MGAHDKLADGLARQAYRGKLAEFLECREATIREIMPIMAAPSRGEMLSPTRIRRAADAIRRRLGTAACAIHAVGDRAGDGTRLVGAVLLCAGRRTIDGRKEDGTTLTAEAVTFILGRLRTGLIVRHLDIDRSDGTSAAAPGPCPWPIPRATEPSSTG